MLEINDAHIAIEIFKEFMTRLTRETQNSNSGQLLRQFIEKYCLSYVDALFDEESVMAKNACALADINKPKAKNKKKKTNSMKENVSAKHHKLEPHVIEAS